MAHPGGRPTHLTAPLIAKVVGIAAEDETLSLVATCQRAGVPERTAYKYANWATARPGSIYAQLAERVKATREAAAAAALAEAQERVRER
jgi:hypothetical protein